MTDRRGYEIGRKVGAVAAGIVIGVGVALALLNLSAVEAGTRVFKYQGF